MATPKPHRVKIRIRHVRGTDIYGDPFSYYQVEKGWAFFTLELNQWLHAYAGTASWFSNRYDADARFASPEDALAAIEKWAEAARVAKGAHVTDTVVTTTEVEI